MQGGGLQQGANTLAMARAWRRGMARAAAAGSPTPRARPQPAAPGAAWRAGAPGALGARAASSASASALRAAASGEGRGPGASRAPDDGGAGPGEGRQLVLHNSMTGRKERFEPAGGPGGRVTMYVCGVTVYDLSHVGHARVYVTFDTLFRVLRRLGYDVVYCRNFTDIDDKIIARANALGEDPLALSRRFIAEFHQDMAALRVLPPTLEPKATEHVDDIIAQIEAILANGHAYAVDGDVYFDVASLPAYGRLSGRRQEDNRAGERVAVDARKRGPADFALWKAAKPGEPTWSSPWGEGRPGWHIECSAMIHALLGPTIDIHGGGRDLLFPHHENELAQSCAACEADSHTFVKYWVHNGFVNVDSEKMSKSLGNFFTIRDVLQSYSAGSLRWFLLGSQYRSGINYTQRALEEAADRLYYVYQTLQDCDAALAAGAAGAAGADGADGADGAGARALAAVEQALADDLNTPLALSALSEPLKALNELLFTKKGRKSKNRDANLAEVSAAVKEVLELLGVDSDDLEASLAEMRAKALVRAGLTEAEVAQRIADRAAARADKAYEAADRIRQDLEARGISLQDGPLGTTFRPCIPVALTQEPAEEPATVA